MLFRYHYTRIAGANSVKNKICLMKKNNALRLLKSDRNILGPSQSDCQILQTIFKKKHNFLNWNYCIVIEIAEICFWGSNLQYNIIGSGKRCMLVGNKPSSINMHKPRGTASEANWTLVILKLISSWTKWLPFHRWHFQKHFNDRKVLYFDWFT